MKKIILLIMSLLSHTAFSKVLIIPSEDASFEIYQHHCQKEGYHCTLPFFISKIKNESSGEYENLILNLDLLKTEQVAQIENSILPILTNSPLDVEQAESLLDLIDKALLLKKSSQLDYLKSVLSKSLNLIKIIPEVSEDQWPQHENIYMVFKKAISVANYSKIRSQIAGINVYKISSHHYPQQINTKNSTLVPLLTGSCESPIYPSSTYNFSEEKVLPLFKNECSFADSWSQSSEKFTSFVKDHKTSLIVTSLAIGAAFFLNKYKMEVRF